MSDWSDDSNSPSQPSAPAHQPPPPPPPRQRREGSGWLTRVFTGVVTSILAISILLNIYLGMFVASMTSGVFERTYEEGDRQQRIVIIPVNGMIADAMASYIRQTLDSLEQDLPKAIVLRVDSPGGTVAASDRIWHELTEFKARHGVPVIASYGSMATSGGYYVSALADHIFTEPSTINGSIGVIAHAMTYGDLLDKVGITPETIVATRADQKDVLNPARDWTEQDRQMLRKYLDETHVRFMNIVMQGRSAHFSTIEDVEKVADGRIFTADEAVKLHLVDAVGYLPDAIAHAKQAAGIAASVDPWVTMIARPQSLYNFIGMEASTPQRWALPTQGFTATQVREWLIELSTPRVEYRWQMAR